MSAKVEGLYYSLITDSIFETKVKKNKVYVKYADKPGKKVIYLSMFNLQLELGFYEVLVDYFMEDM